MDSRDIMIYSIVNITARTGKSRAIWMEMKEILENRGIEYKAFQTRYAGHATDLARKISSLPEDRIYLITVGGDGTLNEVINGITHCLQHSKVFLPGSFTAIPSAMVATLSRRSIAL